MLVYRTRGQECLINPEKEGDLQVELLESGVWDGEP